MVSAMIKASFFSPVAFASLDYNTHCLVSLHLVAHYTTTNNHQYPISLYLFAAARFNFCSFQVAVQRSVDTFSAKSTQCPYLSTLKPKLPYSLSHPLFSNLFLMLQ